MEWIFIAIVVFFLVIIFTKKKAVHPDKEAYPYRISEKWFTPAERSFYGVLTQAIKGRAIIFAKVRVADLITPEKGLTNSDWQSAFNRISKKHIDYVLCSPDDLSVIALVELDDRSHKRRDRVKRDAFLDGACSAAGITLHRFQAKASYNLHDINQVLFPS